MTVKYLKELMEELEKQGYSEMEVIIDKNSSPLIGYVLIEEESKIELQTAW